jgi:uncharacterized protein (DUF58 family)
MSALQPTTERFALIFSQPFRRLRRRVNAWIATRTPRVPGPWAINRRRVYIVPTRYGYGYASLLLVMLLGAMNYSNSMAFALTFLLAGLGLLAMHHTHANLVNISVRASRVPPVFAGDVVRFPLSLDNPSARPRYALAATWAEVPAAAHGDVTAQASVDLSLSLPAPRRGWLPAPRFAVETEFPLGLFHAWTWVELDMAGLVYPQPSPRGERPPAASGGTGTRSGAKAGQEEFAGLRSYQRGDASRSIHWKSLPKLRRPMVKQFAETLEKELWLDWDSLPPGWPVERRLSQLTRWVLDAETEGRVYGLRIPGQTRAAARGDSHRHECLKALALFGT